MNLLIRNGPAQARGKLNSRQPNDPEVTQTIRWLQDGNKECHACHAIFFLFTIMKFPRIVTPVSQKTIILPGALCITSDGHFRLFILVWLQNSENGERLITLWLCGGLSKFFKLQYLFVRCHCEGHLTRCGYRFLSLF